MRYFKFVCFFFLFIFLFSFSTYAYSEYEIDENISMEEIENGKIFYEEHRRIELNHKYEYIFDNTIVIDDLEIYIGKVKIKDDFLLSALDPYAVCIIINKNGVLNYLIDNERSILNDYCYSDGYLFLYKTKEVNGMKYITLEKIDLEGHVQKSIVYKSNYEYIGGNMIIHGANIYLSFLTNDSSNFNKDYKGIIKSINKDSFIENESLSFGNDSMTLYGLSLNNDYLYIVCYFSGSPTYFTEGNGFYLIKTNLSLDDIEASKLDLATPPLFLGNYNGSLSLAYRDYKGLNLLTFTNDGISHYLTYINSLFCIGINDFSDLLLIKEKNKTYLYLDGHMIETLKNCFDRACKYLYCFSDFCITKYRFSPIYKNGTDLYLDGNKVVFKEASNTYKEEGLYGENIVIEEIRNDILVIKRKEIKEYPLDVNIEEGEYNINQEIKSNANMIINGEMVGNSFIFTNVGEYNVSFIGNKRKENRIYKISNLYLDIIEHDTYSFSLHEERLKEDYVRVEEYNYKAIGTIKSSSKKNTSLFLIGASIPMLLLLITLLRRRK